MVSKFLTDLPKKPVPSLNDIILIEDLNGNATKTVSLSNLQDFLFNNTLTTSVCAISGNSSIPFTLSFTKGLLTGISWG